MFSPLRYELATMSIEDDDLLDDPENPDPSDMDRDDYTITVRCPHCKKFIDEEAEQCPRCGMFLTREEPQSERRFPAWVTVGIVLAILAMIYGWVLTLH
jgi:uncharacterized paraquat-inducible protein A